MDQAGANARVRSAIRRTVTVTTDAPEGQVIRHVGIPQEGSRLYDGWRNLKSL